MKIYVLLTLVRNTIFYPFTLGLALFKLIKGLYNPR
jgi:hypothetical protein